MYIEQPANQHTKFFIIINQIGIFFLVKLPEIIVIILEKGSGIVCRNHGIPMQMPPVPMIGNADIFHLAFPGFRFFDRNTQWKNTVGSGNPTPIAIGLFLISIVNFDTHSFGTKKLTVILNRSQIKRRQKNRCHHLLALLNNRFQRIFP